MDDRVLKEEVNLPSKGLVYPKDNPLSSGKVWMRYMTASDEDILTTRNLLRSGKAFNVLLQNLILDDINVDDLIIGDKDALLLAARIMAYGRRYEPTVKDPQDSTIEQRLDIDLIDDIKEKEIDEDLYNNENKFKIKLEKCGAEIEYQLPTSAISEIITKEINAYEKSKTFKETKISRNNTIRLRNLIISINGNNSKKEISDAIKNMPAPDSKQLKQKIEEMMPGIDTEYTYTTDLTGEEVTIRIPFDDPSFFWIG